MAEQFLLEYWMFVEALVTRASELSGVIHLNAYAAALGYPYGAALLLSSSGCALALALLLAGRPGWGLAALALLEELAALSAATAAFSHGFELSLALARLAAAALAVALVCALLRRGLMLSRGTAPAVPGIPPVS